MKSKVILVGGFLGAGKTTLLAEVAKNLSAQGRRVGLVTNDQAPDLVDTAILSQGPYGVEEVSGSCFCCNFPGLLRAMDQLKERAQVDVIVAEPVGSCTDLSATIAQPLKDKHHDAFELAPVSVLADPERLTDILNGGSGGLHPSAAYIFVKQLEEADIIVVSKADLLTADELETLIVRVGKEYPLASIHPVSAKTGLGLIAWLDNVMSGPAAGRHLAEVDYDIYAEGEAVLGWLNAKFTLRGDAIDWRLYIEAALRRMGEVFDARKASVGHVKAMVSAPGGSVVGNLTGTLATLSVRGEAFSAREVTLTVNARVEMSPEAVEAAALQALEETSAGTVEVRQNSLRSLSPGRPTPTYRYGHLVTIDAGT